MGGRGEPKAATEKDGLFLGNEYGCGRDSDNGLNSCGLDVVAPPDVEASDTDNGSPKIDVLGLLLNPEVENKAGVEVLIESDLLMSCLLVCTLERSSSTTVPNICATSSSFLDFGTSLSHSSDLSELVEASARRSSSLDKPNVREVLEVEGVSLESSRSRRIDEKYPGPNEDPNCPFPTLVGAETFWLSRLNARSLESTLELCSTLCKSLSLSSSTFSISTVCDLGVPLKRSTSHAGEKKSLTVSITPFFRPGGRAYGLADCLSLVYPRIL